MTAQFAGSAGGRVTVDFSDYPNLAPGSDAAVVTLLVTLFSVAAWWRRICFFTQTLVAVRLCAFNPSESPGNWHAGCIRSKALVLSVIHIQNSSKGVCHVGSVTENPTANSNRSPRHHHDFEGQGRDGADRHRSAQEVCVLRSEVAGKIAQADSVSGEAEATVRSALAATERERTRAARIAADQPPVARRNSRIEFASSFAVGRTSLRSHLAARSEMARARLGRRAPW